jgi:hypothetical protein
MSPGFIFKSREGGGEGTKRGNLKGEVIGTIVQLDD